MARKPTHGKRYTKEYHAWSHMKDRCLNPKNKRYSDYGGRGITVCDRWLVFENFFEDMGLAPSKAHTLERIDNDGIYEKSNCKWATNKEQQQNTRQIRLVIPDTCNIKRSTVKSRIQRGWTLEKALTEPVVAVAILSSFTNTI